MFSSFLYTNGLFTPGFDVHFASQVKFSNVSPEIDQNMKSYLKKQRNYFYVRHENRRKHNHHFKHIFTSIFTLRKTTKTSLILVMSIHLVLPSLEIQKGGYRPSILQVFLLCLKRNDSRTFKSSNCKKLFLQCVCYGYNFFR